MWTKEAKVEPPIAEPRAALSAFLQELKTDYVDWYEGSVKLHVRIWGPMHIGSLVLIALTAILAALATDDWFKDRYAMRILLVIMPVTSAALTSAILQSKLQERSQMRENGRRATQNLWNEGRQRFAAAKSAEECSAIHKDLVECLDRIEREQSEAFFSLIGAGVMKPKENQTT